MNRTKQTYNAESKNNLGRFFSFNTMPIEMSGQSFGLIRKSKWYKNKKSKPLDLLFYSLGWLFNLRVER
jgi:hypothetical protein